ncbi:glycosyltransferase N-terminal domain-containing protein [Antarcticibacterium sp. 1MA-6-2]|uniref:3-deoxy-D-manno-octulosonic acid transferase n=1 Tax=Antarcticibacterium sp. 1MA-6-2 TaxID=2908210 RepID=UPI00288339AC|nr:glycosyltransferase N-terminal domain-containing protein [Antarcticibacterium sp. 1MA-6-2]
MKKFIDGRKETFSILQQKIDPLDKVVWFHVASLGEYEQGLPIIETVKELFPSHKIVISFFSPSGYENKKNSTFADAVVYLPLDTPSNAAKFLNFVHPDLALFIKYDFWPNYLKELQNRNIPSLLISGGFRKDQLFFKSYGDWMRKPLKTFEYFFVQNEQSLELLKSIGIENVTVSGDTRFDRVSRQLKQNNKLAFIEEFLNNKECIVAGSTWPEDDILMQNFINEAPSTVKFIVAPHEIKPEKIRKLKNSFSKRAILFTEKEDAQLSDYEILILDTIGLLTKVYSYADIAYVGGAAGKTGLHNILEPATFGVPIVTGSNIENFPEAIQLQKIAKPLYCSEFPGI